MIFNSSSMMSPEIRIRTTPLAEITPRKLKPGPSARRGLPVQLRLALPSDTSDPAFSDLLPLKATQATNDRSPAETKDSTYCYHAFRESPKIEGMQRCSSPMFGDAVLSAQSSKGARAHLKAKGLCAAFAKKMSTDMSTKFFVPHLLSFKTRSQLPCRKTKGTHFARYF